MANKQTRAVAMAAAVFTFSACSVDAPEQRLRDTLDAIETAVEARQPADVLRHVASDFSGGAERLDRQRLRGYLAAQMAGSRTIEVVMGPAKISIQGDRATVELEALVVGGRLLPERGERLRVVSGWRDEGGEWRCYRADWRRAGEAPGGP